MFAANEDESPRCIALFVSYLDSQLNIGELHQQIEQLRFHEKASRTITKNQPCNGDRQKTVTKAHTVSINKFDAYRWRMCVSLSVRMWYNSPKAAKENSPAATKGEFSKNYEC